MKRKLKYGQKIKHSLPFSMTLRSSLASFSLFVKWRDKVDEYLLAQELFDLGINILKIGY